MEQAWRKQPREWTEEDLLLVPDWEASRLEVKGRRGLDLTVNGVKENHVRRELSIALSALANSGGGLLIYGMVNPGHGAHVDDGGVCKNVKQPSTKEWLENVIPGLVDPMLSSFDVYPVDRQAEDSQIAEGRAVYLIEVRDSEQAPHQACDNKYYARVAGKSQPIGHRMVADIFERRQHARLELEFGIASEVQWVESPDGGERVRLRRVMLHVVARNCGRVYAQYVSCRVRVAQALLPDEYAPVGNRVVLDGVDYCEFWLRNTVRDTDESEAGELVLGPSRYQPILPGLSHRWELPLNKGFPDWRIRGYGAAGAPVHWEVYADNAVARTGQVILSDLRFRYW